MGVVDLTTMKLSRTLMTYPSLLQEVLVQPDGTHAYVSWRCEPPVVAVIDLKEWKVAKLISTGLGNTDGLAWASRKQLKSQLFLMLDNQQPNH